MPAPRTIKPPILCKDVAMRVADVARVPTEEREQFCEMLQSYVQDVWEIDRRAVSSRPGQALIDAAQAARALYKAFGRLNKQDREWVDKVFVVDLWSGKLSELPLTVMGLAHLFSTATGQSPPRSPDRVTSPRTRNGRQRSLKDPTFRKLVILLLVFAEQTYGKFTFTKSSGTGTLIDALDILREHLPKGVVPTSLPLATIQEIKTNYRDFYEGFPELEISSPKRGRHQRPR